MRKVFHYLEIPFLIAVPALLVACTFLKISQAAILTLVVTLIALLVFFAHFEMRKPALRQIMPVVVLGAFAAAGRILFAAIPNFKPVTAICIVAGVVFGKRAGFMVGALAALISNFFFGHGPWTPWQMYAWGMIGYFAGILADYNLFKHQAVVCVYGFVAAILYGVLLNTWHIIGFVRPLTWQSATIAYGASLPFDVVHGIATVAFLLVIFVPWGKKLTRIKEKYSVKE